MSSNSHSLAFDELEEEMTPHLRLVEMGQNPDQHLNLKEEKPLLIQGKVTVSF